MSLRNQLLTAVVAGVTVALVSGGMSSIAASSPTSSVTVCVNKKTQAMRSAKTCKKTETLLKLATLGYVDTQVAGRATQSYVDTKVSDRATQSYVDTQVATRAPAKVKVGLPTAVSAANASRASNPSDDEQSLTELAAGAVQTVVKRVTIPNKTGIDYDAMFATEPAPSVFFANCPSKYPIRFTSSVYSTNYGSDVIGNVTNSDMTQAVGFMAGDAKVTFTHWTYPKDGDMDLYLVTLCAPITVEKQ